VLVDTLTILVAWYTAFLIRHGQTPSWSAEVLRFTETAPLAIIGVLVGLWVRGLYRTDWQHLSLHELRAIVTGALLGLGLSALTLELLGDDVARRPGLLAIAFGTNVMMLAGSRVFVRALADLPRMRTTDRKRTLIYGAGRGGELAVRELRGNLLIGQEPVAFLDDNPLRKGMTLHGLPVLGGVDALGAILGEHVIDAILVSTGKLTPEREAALARIAGDRGVALFRLNIAVVPFEAHGAESSLTQSQGTIRSTHTQRSTARHA
jgi:FlaA1/EpsC-like NDP-sugar epimerase